MRKAILFLIAFVASSSLFAQDKLVYRANGNVEEVKIMEITADEIVYKEFTNQDGPVYRISPSLLEKIVLQTGREIVYSKHREEGMPKSLTARSVSLFDGTKKLKKDELAVILDEDLLSSYKSGKALGIIGTSVAIPSIFIGIAGGLLFGMPHESGSSLAPAIVITSVGITGTITGIVLAYVGMHKVATVADKYNIIFGSTTNGVGLSISF